MLDLIVACYAELASAIPIHGGPVVYLDYVYGPLSSFLFSWTTIIVGKPVSAAMLAIIFGEYVNRIIFAFWDSNASEHVWADKIVALLCLWVVIGQNMMGLHWAAVVNKSLTIIKLTTLMVISFIGIFVLGISLRQDMS
jgi:amino acid transporter